MTNQLNNSNFSNSTSLIVEYFNDASVKDENLSCVAVIGTLGATSVVEGIIILVLVVLVTILMLKLK